MTLVVRSLDLRVPAHTPPFLAEVANFRESRCIVTRSPKRVKTKTENSGQHSKLLTPTLQSSPSPGKYDKAHIIDDM